MCRCVHKKPHTFSSRVHRLLCMQTPGKNENTLTQRFVATGERIQSAIVHRTRPGLTSSQRAPRDGGAKHSLTKHSKRARGHYTLCACPALALACVLASGRFAVYVYVQGRRAVIVHYVCNCACTPHRFAIVLCLVHSHTHSTAQKTRFPTPPTTAVVDITRVSA